MKITYTKINTIIINLYKDIYSTRRDIPTNRDNKFNKIINYLININLIKNKSRKELMKRRRGVVGDIVRLKNFKTEAGYVYKLTKKGYQLKRLLLLIKGEETRFKADIMEKYLNKKDLLIIRR